MPHPGRAALASADVTRANLATSHPGHHDVETLKARSPGLVDQVGERLEEQLWMIGADSVDAEAVERRDDIGAFLVPADNAEPLLSYRV